MVQKTSLQIRWVHLGWWLHACSQCWRTVKDKCSELPDTSSSPVILLEPLTLLIHLHGQFIRLYVSLKSVRVNMSQRGKMIQNTDCVQRCFISQRYKQHIISDLRYWNNSYLKASSPHMWLPPEMAQNNWISTKAGMIISHDLYSANSNITVKCEFQTKLKNIMSRDPLDRLWYTKRDNLKYKTVWLHNSYIKKGWLLLYSCSQAHDYLSPSYRGLLEL